MKRVSFYSALLLCLTSASTLSYADAPPKKEEEALAKAATQKFGGLSMGVGLSLTHDLGWNDRVSKAQLVNGIVRVDEQKNDLARIMLELHYFFTPPVSFGHIPSGSWGHGPFVAIAPGGNEKIIDAIGLGWMIGFRNHIWDEKKQTYTGWANASWNFGVGFVVDANSKILGDGIRANQPLPAGETAIRYKDTSQGGIMFITSFSF